MIWYSNPLVALSIALFSALALALYCIYALRRQLAEARRRAAELSVLSQTDVNKFLVNMRHELHTPLNAVLGISEALQEEVYGPLNADQSRSLRSIEQSGRELLNLINDILDLSKVEAGRLTLEPTQVSPQEMCQASLRFIRQAAHKKELRVVVAIDPTATIIWADGRRLKQILVHLLSDAVKFAPIGGRIGLETQGEPTQKLIHFTVWDEGVSVAPEDASQLVQPVAPADGRLPQKQRGDGLSLALVAHLTELHGGAVSHVGVAGQGSRFTVSLPWEPESGVGQTDNTADTTTAAPTISYGKTILLAEDNEIFIETMSDYLTGKGYRVLTARNGREAIETALAMSPDLIIMDIEMPEVNGLQAIERLRATEAMARTPIIALTALSLPEDLKRCLAAGANTHLSKPFRLSQLTGVIEEMWTQK